MRRIAAAAVAVVGCTSGAPPGYSGGGGDTWTFQLIGPLEDGLLLTPVSINDKGPFVFAIDPDAVVSIVDEQVVKEAGLRLDDGHGPRMLDESDTKQIRFYAEVLSYEIGTLVVQGQKPALVVKAGTFDTTGRRVHGVLGRNVLADSLVFGFDRDAGLGYLATAKGFAPPPGSKIVAYEELGSRIQNAEVIPIPRRIAKATIEGTTATLHLDLGAPVSQLRESLWSKANLTAQERDAVVLDEVGSQHKSTKLVTASVSIGDVTNPRVTFVPYGDKRWETTDLDGTLGLDFFRSQSVWASWDKRKYYLTPRKDVLSTAKTRVARWELAVKCEHPGCVAVKIIDPLAGKPADATVKHPGVVVSITRDPPAGGSPLEATLLMTPGEGKPEIPWLIVNMPANVDRVMDHESADLVGATPTVIDVSPYPRRCPNAGGCVDHFNPATASQVKSVDESCRRLLEHLTDLELKKAGAAGTPEELAKQRDAIIQAKSAEFVEACAKTPKARVECALAAADLDAVAKCDAK